VLRRRTGALCSSYQSSGSGAGVASKSVLFRAVKTGDLTYNLYRIAG
jgi:hypothetical protein